MAQQENTLGAPTEGLGQTVTFAFGQDGGVPQLQLGGTTMVNAGIQGGRVPGNLPLAQDVKAQPNPMFDMVMAVADSAIKKNVERKKAEAFVIGMQRAAAGEAVTDIAAEQPWYTKIFGDSDVVEGARVYASQTVAQTQVAAMEDAMPELRKKTPAEAQQFFINSVNANLTGDPVADAAIMQSMSRALPQVMRRQTKEHYGWLQENATTQETAAFRAGATNLQAQAKALGKDFRNSEEFKVATQEFVASVMPADGRDLDSYQKSMTANLRSWAQNGEFHALNALRDSGFMDVLTADQVTLVDKAVETGENRLINKYSFEWNDQLTDLTMASQNPDVGVTPQQIAERIDALNQQYGLETGSKQGIISPSMRTAMISRSRAEIVQEQNKQAAAALSRNDKVVETQVITQAAMLGTLGNLQVSREKKDPVATSIYNSLSAEDQVKFLVNNDRQDYTIETVKRDRVGAVTAALSSGVFDQQAQDAFAQYKALRDVNPHTAAAYYGEHAKALEGMYNDQKANMSLAGSFRNRFVGPQSRAQFTKEQMKEALAVVGEGQNWFMRQFTGEQKLQPGQQSRIVNEISEDTKGWYGANNDFTLATNLSLKSAKSRGMEIMGGLVWTNGKNQEPLEKWLTRSQPTTGEEAIGTNKINDVMAYAVNEALYGESGVLTETAKDLGVFRLDDRAGVPTFQIQAVQPDGTVTDRLLTGNEIFALARKRKMREDIAASPLTQKQEELRKDVQKSREQAAGFKNPLGIKE